LRCIVAIWILIFLSSCWNKPGRRSASPSRISDDSLMSLVQYRTFLYFWDGAEPNSGMARARFHVDDIYPMNDKHIVTAGGSGFGLMAILVGIERGFISRSEGVERLLKIVEFLENTDRFHGLWPHWINGKTGKVKPFSRKDNGADGVESAYLFQGLLTVRQYFQNGNKQERELSGKIDRLWKEAEWNWFTKGENVLYWHWSPDLGWAMNHKVQGYNECLIYYVIAASSPTHPVTPGVYHEGWARNGEIAEKSTTYGYTLQLRSRSSPVYGGPLFWAHYSYMGLDPRGLKDRYGDYWEHNRAHTLINRQWCIENPNGFKGYGPDCWGLTAGYSYKEGGGIGYKAHKPDKKDIGVISPTAAISSIPYTPEYSMQAMRTFYEVYGDRLFGVFGFYDAFSPQYDWFPERYLAIDQGPIVVMIENYRTGLLWELFMSCPEIRAGLDKLGFEWPGS
jgi:hypothetical protein